MLEMEKKLDKAEIEYFGLKRLCTDDAQMAYYTGLPSYSVFKCLLSFLEPHLSAVHRHSDAGKGRERRLAPADELVMVLMRLRTGMHIKDLAYRFGFKSVSHVSVLLQCWISFLSKVLDCLIIWPSRQQIKRNMPSAFQMSSEYKTIRCILDCTEFAIQAPSALSLNAMTYSDYKGQHTVKILCCITPDGHISFVSKAFPGSISDNAITMRSGMLDLFEPGDRLLADKGFTISNTELQPRGVTLIVPPFRCGDAQFSPSEVKGTRKIAALRVTVENAISRLKYYKLLKNTLPINSLHAASDMIKVAAALRNFRPPLRK